MVHQCSAPQNTFHGTCVKGQKTSRLVFHHNLKTSMFRNLVDSEFLQLIPYNLYLGQLLNHLHPISSAKQNIVGGPQRLSDV